MHTITLPTGVEIGDGAVVRLSSYPDRYWVLHYGWYPYQCQQFMGWYFVSVPDKMILPMKDEDLLTITVISTDIDSCGPYPSCPPCDSYTHCNSCSSHAMHVPEAEWQINRSFITVDNIAQRDQLNCKLLPDGKIVKVNDVDGEPVYFTWDKLQHRWNYATFPADTSQMLSKEEAEIVFVSKSDLPSRLDQLLPYSETVQTMQQGIDNVNYDLNRAIMSVASEPRIDGGSKLTFRTRSGDTLSVDLPDIYITHAEYDDESEEIRITQANSTDLVVIDVADLKVKSLPGSKITLDEDVIVTSDVGHLSKGDKLSSDSVKSIEQLLRMMIGSDVAPTATLPSASIVLKNAGAMEVGTTFVPEYSADLTAGSYSDTINGSQETGIHPTEYSIHRSDAETVANEASGQLDTITVSDSTDFYLTADIAYSGGTVPSTYLGNPAPNIQIPAGEASATSDHVIGYRNCFWGYMTDSTALADPTTISLNQVKALGNAAPQPPLELHAEKMQQIFVAVPASSHASLRIVGEVNPLPLNVKGPMHMQIGGVNNFEPIDYAVFYVSNAVPSSGADTFKFIWDD